MLILVIFKDNWCDEIDFTEYKIMLLDKWQDLVIGLEEFFTIADCFTINFGTNQQIEYNSLYELLDCFIVKYITLSQANTITKLLGESSVNFPSLEYKVSDYG